MLRSATVLGTFFWGCEADCNSCNQVRPSHLLGISLGRLEGKHTLTITKTSVDTFGNYSCVAKNSLGTFKKHIEVRLSTKYLWWRASITRPGRFTGGQRKQLSSAQAASLDLEVFNSPGRFAPYLSLIFFKSSEVCILSHFISHFLQSFFKSSEVCGF